MLTNYLGGCGNSTSGTCGCGCNGTANTCGCGNSGTSFIEELVGFFVMIIVLESVLGLFCNILP